MYREPDNDINEVANYHELLLFPIVVILLFVSIGFNLYFYFNGKKQVEELEQCYTKQINSLADSLTYELELTKTQVELKTIHEIYGKISISKEKTKQPNPEDIWEFILTLDTWYPEYIMAQAIVESSCGTLMPQNSNNMFGMTVPKSRETVAINTKSDDKYAKYNNWKESVIDRVLWELNAFDCIKPTEDEYIEKLKGYASSPTYLSAIKKISKQYKQ